MLTETIETRAHTTRDGVLNLSVNVGMVPNGVPALPANMPSWTCFSRHSHHGHSTIPVRGSAPKSATNSNAGAWSPGRTISRLLPSPCTTD
jgi:hypothetical protein